MKTAKVNLEEFRVTGDYPHYVGACTRGFMELPDEDREAIMKAFYAAPKGDHFYCISLDGKKYFIVENGEMGYTAMLPEEY